VSTDCRLDFAIHFAMPKALSFSEKRYLAFEKVSIQWLLSSREFQPT